MNSVKLKYNEYLTNENIGAESNGRCETAAEEHCKCVGEEQRRFSGRQRICYNRIKCKYFSQYQNRKILKRRKKFAKIFTNGNGGDSTKKVSKV